MTNADFSKQDKAPGGFTADSYRTKKAPAEKPLTPMQKKLAALEKALPSFLRRQATAVLILVLVAMVSVFGVGGGKFRGQYRKAVKSFSVGVAEDVESGSQYTVQAQLDRRAGAAANVILAAQGFAGVDQNMVAQAQTALDALNMAMADDAGPAALYDADAALEAALNLLHADVQAHAADATKTGAEQTAFSQFASAGNTLHHLSYNDAAQAYNNAAAGFPAAVIGKLWGCGKVELFA